MCIEEHTHNMPPACLSACLPHCLPACLPACSTACLRTCLLAPPVCLPACLPDCLPACRAGSFSETEHTIQAAHMLLLTLQKRSCHRSHHLKWWRYIFATPLVVSTHSCRCIACMERSARLEHSGVSTSGSGSDGSQI